MKKLRVLFPRVVSGLIFCFIALEVGSVSLKAIFDTSVPFHSPLFQLRLGIYLFTLLIIIALSIWAKGLLKLLCIIIGLTLGCILAYLLHLFSTSGLSQLQQAAYFHIPSISFIHYSFAAQLIPIFLICGLAASLRTVGVITTCQQINDANWKRPDQESLKRGVMADGLSVIISGVLSTMGVGVSPSAVGITKATGATSRVIAYGVATFCFIFALIPKIAALFLAIPLVVVAAGLTFASCLMLVGGLRIITSQDLDMRKTIITGLSLLIALSPKFFPKFFQQLPFSIQSITNSIMVLGTLAALLLNLLFRIGIRRFHQVILNQSQLTDLSSVIERLSEWQIDKYLIQSVIDSSKTLVQLIIENHLNTSDINFYISYDELNLKLTFSYQGALPNLVLDKALSETDLLEENVFIQGLSSLYKNIYPDKIKLDKKDKTVTIVMEFYL